MAELLLAQKLVMEGSITIHSYHHFSLRLVATEWTEQKRGVGGHPAIGMQQSRQPVILTTSIQQSWRQQEHKRLERHIIHTLQQS